jgi:hypothetical protein
MIFIFHGHIRTAPAAHQAEGVHIASPQGLLRITRGILIILDAKRLRLDRSFANDGHLAMTTEKKPLRSRNQGCDFDFLTGASGSVVDRESH